MKKKQKPVNNKTPYISGKTEGQKEYIRGIVENTVIFCQGPAGSGKTYIAAGIAAQYLIEGRVDKIVLTRPLVQVGKGLGFLPGDLSMKVSPYLTPLVEELTNILGVERYTQLSLEGRIIIEPLELMRGRNFHDAFMILDEAQNCTQEQITMFVTRMGQNSKVCINGDSEQNDLYGCALLDVLDYTKELPQFTNVVLTDADIVRNDLIGRFLKAVRNGKARE